jgi:hypothetical protein
MLTDLLLLALIIFVAIPALLFALYAALAITVGITVGPLLILGEKYKEISENIQSGYLSSFLTLRVDPESRAYRFGCWLRNRIKPKK